jgi:hypothetical protein
MRRVFATLALLLAGCGPEFAVVPRNGLERAQAQAPMGITMTAHADQWAADPYDLADYVTPILVELYNPGPYEVRVSLVDFALRDERGTRYQAINPFIPAVLGEADPRDTRFMLAANGMTAPALPSGTRSLGLGGPPAGMRGGVSVGPPPARGMSPGGGGFRYQGSHSRGYIGPPPGRRGGYYGRGAGVWGWSGGFRLSPGLRGYYGLGAYYWDYPFIRPPYYWDWVFWWGPSYYPSSYPSQDVLAFALPEGVLPANTRVQGFLYFKKATAADRRNLDLAWELVDGRASNNLGSLHVPLEVVRR